MSDEQRIRPGTEVVMHFRLVLEDGTVAESSEDGGALRFVVGDGTLIQGLERALYGLRAGDHQHVELEPGQAFGLPDPDNVHLMPASDFGGLDGVQTGAVVGFTTPAGDELAGVVVEILDDQVKVDFNHPLAGHRLSFDVDVVEVTAPD